MVAADVRLLVLGQRLLPAGLGGIHPERRDRFRHRLRDNSLAAAIVTDGLYGGYDIVFLSSPLDAISASEP
jgi:hypothetical protein